MIFKMWVKSKVVFWQPRYNNLLTKKKVRKNFRFEALIFLKIILLLTSQKNLIEHQLQNIYLGELLHGQIQLF